VFVRTTVIEGRPDKVEEGIAFYTGSMVPQARRIDGFLGALLLVDRATGRNLGLTFWESETALRASEAAADKLRRDGVDRVAPGASPTVQRYEVAYYGVPAVEAV
jgi:hypothetical protein